MNLFSRIKSLIFNTLYLIKGGVREKVILFILSLKKFKIEDSIIICGESRSGTTWLLEILNKIQYNCVHWEPFHQRKGVTPKQWKGKFYISKEDKNPHYRKLIEDIFKFKVYNHHTISKIGSIKLFLRSKFVITKSVRIHLSMPYVLQNFTFKNKPILIIRHPIDTCLSQIRAFKSSRILPLNLPSRVSHWFNNERYLKEMDYLKSLTSVLEHNIAVWCIANCPLLKDKDTLKKITVVFYSDLVLHPEKETRNILNKLNCVKKTDIDTIISSIPFTQPSETDFANDYIPNPEQQLQKNIARLSIKEKDSIQQVFDHFNFKLYDAYSVFPKKEYLEK